MDRDTIRENLTGRHYDVVYITPETHCDGDWQTGSGGLGVVADSYLYELEHNYGKHGVNALQIALFSSWGYQRQIVKNVDGGFMNATYRQRIHPAQVVETGIQTTLSFAKQNCTIAAKMPQENRRHTTRLLLDTDLSVNAENFRMITRVLYGEKHATEFFSKDGRPWHNIDWLRILQAGVLGLGSYYLLKELGITYKKLHLNESHSALFLVHQLGVYMEKGLSFDEAVAKLHENNVFTNHTMLESGNKRYSTHDISRIFSAFAGFSEETLRRCGQKSHHTFAMTDATLFLVGPGNTNAVSKQHGDIANARWPGHNIISITNGVSTRYQDPEFKNLTDPQKIPDLKKHFKELIYIEMTERLREAGWEKEIVTPSLDAVLMVWARRCQEYKRPGLILHNKEIELLKVLLDWDWAALLWGGYVHPDDTSMMNEWNRLWQRLRQLKNTMPIFNYDIGLIRPRLKAASQIWLNTPWFEHEACGTSGMGAALNCSLEISMRDGWKQETTLYVPFGSEKTGDWHEQFSLDAQSLLQAITVQLPRVRSNDPAILDQLMRTKLETEERFSSERMVNDYIEKLYRFK